MDQKKTTLERAFELARSGECGDMTELRRRLTSEHYTMGQLSGPQLFRQLREIMKEVNAAESPKRSLG